MLHCITDHSMNRELILTVQLCRLTELTFPAFLSSRMPYVRSPGEISVVCPPAAAVLYQLCCKVYEAAEDGAERSLEPLNVGPELEPITEETTPESTPRVVVPPARRPVLTSAGQIRTEAKVATVCKDGVSRRDRQRERAYSDSKHAQVGVCENRTENVDRSATSAEVIATDAQRPVMRPKAGCVLAEDVAEGRGANGTQLPSARGSSSKVHSAEFTVMIKFLRMIQFTVRCFQHGYSSRVRCIPLSACFACIDVVLHIFVVLDFFSLPIFRPRVTGRTVCPRTHAANGPPCQQGGSPVTHPLLCPGSIATVVSVATRDLY